MNSIKAAAEVLPDPRNEPTRTPTDEQYQTVKELKVKY